MESHSAPGYGMLLWLPGYSCRRRIARVGSAGNAKAGPLDVWNAFSTWPRGLDTHCVREVAADSTGEYLPAYWSTLSTIWYFSEVAVFTVSD